MSEYIATAFVRVLPDTKSFEGQLRKDVRAAITKVGPQKIRLTVDPTGLQGDVRKKVRAAITASGTHLVPVTPQLTSFKQGFADELKANPILIPVQPDMAPFITELREKVATANKGLKVTIPVVTEEGGRVQRGGGAGGGAGGRTDAGVLRSIARARSDAQERMRIALNAKNVITEEDISLEKRLTAAGQARETLEKTLIKTTDELAFARKQGNTELARSLKTQRDFVESDLLFVRGEEEKLKAIAKSTEETKKQADAEERLASSRSRIEDSSKTIRSKFDESARLREIALDKQDIPLKERLSELAKAEKPLIEAQKAARAGLIEARKLENNTIARGFVASQREIKAKIAALKTDAASVLARAAEEKVINKSIGSITTLTELKKVEISANEILKKVEAELKIARELGNQELIETLTLLKQKIVTSQAEIATQRQSIREQAKAASQQKLLARGAGATGLSLLGVRGATLAASAAFLVGAAAVASFAKAIKSATDLETEINVFGEITKATTAQMKLAAEEARKLGADITLPAVGANDAAEAFSELAKAGLDVKDSIEGARGVLQLATAANISNAEAVQLAASALNAFGLAGEEATRVADLLTGAANEAQGSVSDMGIALQQSSAVSRLAGISLEDTVAFLTLLARNGLRGSDAGTSLRTALTRLIRPTEKAAKEIARLGVNIRDAEGNIRPDVFDQFAQALSNTGKAQADATLAMIFGQDALRAAAILGREGADGLNAMRAATQQQGLAAELAGARTQGFAGKVEALKNSMQTTGTVIGAALLPPLGEVIASLERTVSGLTESGDAADFFSGVLDGLVGAVSGLARAMGTLASAMRPVVSFFASWAGAAGRAFAAIGTDFQAAIIGSIIALKSYNSALRANAAAMAILGGASAEGAGLVTRMIVSFNRLGGRSSSFFATLASNVALATGAFGKMRVAAAGLTAGLVGLFSSATAIGLGIAVLAGGLIYLASRESSAEKATKRLADASRDLADALAEADSASKNAVASRFAVANEQLAVIEAQIALTQARNALGGSSAAPGSAERIRLVTDLRAANLALEESEQRLADAITQTRLAEEEAEQARHNRRDAVREEKEAIKELIEVERDRQLQIARNSKEGREARGDRAAAEILAEAASIEEVIKKLNEEAAANKKINTEFSRDIAKRQILLARLIKQQDEMATPRQISIIFDSGTVEAAVSRLSETIGLEGGRAVKLWKEGFTAGLAGFEVKVSEYLRGPFADAASRAAYIAGDKSGSSFDDAFMRHLPNAQDRAAQQLGISLVPGIDTQIAVAEARGASDAELLALQKQKKRILEKKLKFFESKPLTDAIEEKIEETANELTATNNAIQSILDGQASEAKKAQDEQIKARNEADQAILNSISNKEKRLENALLIAESKKGLRDDLKVQIAIRNFWKTTAIEQIKTINDQQTRAAALLDANKKRIQAQKDIDETRKAIRDAVLQQQADLRRGVELNIEFFSTIGNISREIAARQRLIKLLKRAQKLTEKGSNEWKEYRNAIAKEQQAIKDLKEQTKERDRAAQSLIFTFLQSQQGFAANLFGNLIPGFATGGLVNSATGGGATSTARGGAILKGAGGDAARGFGGGLGGALIKNAQEQNLNRREGPSQGQMSELIEVNRQIVRLLARIAGDTRHPESKRSKMSSRAMLDILNS